MHQIWIQGRRSGANLHTDSDLTDWSDQEFANLSMQQALRGIEADPVIYTDADLRERWG